MLKSASWPFNHNLWKKAILGHVRHKLVQQYLTHKNLQFVEIFVVYMSSRFNTCFEITKKTNYAHLNWGSINLVDMGANYQPGIVGT